MYSSAAALVRGSDKIGSPPEVFVRLNEALNRGNYSVDELAGIVAADAGLTVRLLCVANSSFFGFSRKIVNLSEAIGAIGVNHLRELVTATSVINKFGSMPGSLVSMDAFWRHSVAVGLAARILAGARKELNLENYFIAGVLHDVGRLLMLLKMAEPYRQVIERCRASGELLYVVERERFAFRSRRRGRGAAPAVELVADAGGGGGRASRAAQRRAARDVCGGGASG